LVNNDDIVIHLGDFIVGKESEFANLLNELTGRKVLLIGNHDKKSLTWYLNNGFDFACKTFTWDYLGYKLLFSHKPQLNIDYIDINIHGHLHEKRHHNEFILTDKHCLFSLEDEKYHPILLKTFLEKKGF